MSKDIIYEKKIAGITKNTAVDTLPMPPVRIKVTSETPLWRVLRAAGLAQLPDESLWDARGRKVTFPAPENAWLLSKLLMLRAKLSFAGYAVKMAVMYLPLGEAISTRRRYVQLYYALSNTHLYTTEYEAKRKPRSRKHAVAKKGGKKCRH